MDSYLRQFQAVGSSPDGPAAGPARHGSALSGLAFSPPGGGAAARALPSTGVSPGSSSLAAALSPFASLHRALGIETLCLLNSQFRRTLEYRPSAWRLWVCEVKLE